MSLKNIIESIVFVSSAPVSREQLCELLHGTGREEITDALKELQLFYEQRNGGFLLVEVAEGWQFRTAPEYHPYLQRHLAAKPSRLSPSALETLAIVAYRQPITRVEIEHLRGVDSGGVLKTLLDKRLVRILGKRDLPGRPLIYGTTREFLEVFGLKNLKGLPTLKEIQALDELSSSEQQSMQLSLDGVDPNTEQEPI